MRDIIILGGPNGAGKTTAAQVLIPREFEVREFVNADEIARGLSPFNVESVALKAGRLMLERIDELIGANVSFAFETTCAGKGHARWLARCKTEGWRITFIYLWLPTIEMARDRVARRVAHGGHAIPDDVIARRYATGIKNMIDLYLPLADYAAIYDNSNRARTLIAELAPMQPLEIRERERWARMQGGAKR